MLQYLEYGVLESLTCIIHTLGHYNLLYTSTACVAATEPGMGSCSVKLCWALLFRMMLCCNCWTTSKPPWESTTEDEWTHTDADVTSVLKDNTTSARPASVAMYPSTTSIPNLTTRKPACGGLITSEKGYLKTPNFPDQYPLPVKCIWVLRAPYGYKTILYMTQYYLHGVLHVAEYDHYVNELDNRGRLEHSNHIDDKVLWLRSNKTYLVLTFQVWETSNIHVRVEGVEDMYGFNITYEMVRRDASVRPDTCSARYCSFLGQCYVNQEWSRYGIGIFRL